MQTASESIRVTINGNEYSIRADVDRETTVAVADYVNQKMDLFQKNSASRDQLKAAVLSALNIAGELFELRSRLEQTEHTLGQIQQKATELSKKLDTLV